MASNSPSDRIESLFEAAVELPAEARAAFLDRECAGDQAARRQLGALLHAHERANHLLDRAPAEDAGVTVASAPNARLAGTIIAGKYKLLEQIGEGGMGTVFMAEQELPVRRKVAVKIIKPGMDSRQVVARFEAERQALAMMDHANIARVLDAGATESGQPFFVMELVHGVPIIEYCDANRLTPRQRLELFIPVCLAIHHAHQKGIIHRDIKPSNVLVTMYDDKPVPKVIDFGVAKAVEHRLTAKTLFTNYGALVGTFEYSSPEQAEMNAFGVDTRSDVYSLGVLLYELLTGTTPLERKRLQAAAFGEIVRLIKEEEPQRPSIRLSTSATISKLAEIRKTEPAKLPALVRGELDWIVMKCLEKDRTRRYDGANGLAKDVQRYLGGDTVEACPPTLSYRMGKLYRRHRAAILTVVSFAAVLIIASGVSIAFGLFATRAKRASERDRNAAITARFEAEQQREKVAQASNALQQKAVEERRSRYLTDMNFAQVAFDAGQPGQTLQLINSYLPTDGQEDLRDLEWYYWKAQFKQDAGATLIHGVDPDTNRGGPVLSADGKKAAVYSSDVGKLRLIDLESGKDSWSVPIDCDAKSSVQVVCLSDDGHRILTQRSPKTTARSSEDAKFELCVWEAGSEKPLFAKEEPHFILQTSFSHNGELVAWFTRTPAPRTSALHVFRVADGKEVHAAAKPTLGMAMSFAFSADDKQVVVTTRMDSPDSRIVYRSTLKVLEIDGGSETDLATYEGLAWIVGFSKDGRRLAIAANQGDGTAAIIWDMQERRQERVLLSRHLPGRLFYYATGAFAPSGKILALEVDGRILLLDADPDRPAFGDPVISVLPGQFGGDDVAFDGERLRTLARDGKMKVWDLTERTRRLKTEFTSQSWLRPIVRPSADGSRLAFLPRPGAKSPRFRLVDSSGRQIVEIELPGGSADNWGFARDGRLFAFSWRSHEVFVSVWDTNTGMERFRKKVAGKEDGRAAGRNLVAVSPDSSRVCFTTFPDSENCRIQSWDAQTGQQATIDTVPREELESLVFSADSRWLVAVGPGSSNGAAPSGTPRGILRCWDAASGKLRLTFRPDISPFDITFSGDSRLIALVSYNEDSMSSPTTIWDWAAILRGEHPRPISTLRVPDIRSGHACFSTSGRRILTSTNGSVTVYDTGSGKQVLTLRANGVDRAQFSLDDQHIWAGLDENGRLWGWDAPREDDKP